MFTRRRGSGLLGVGLPVMARVVLVVALVATTLVALVMPASRAWAAASDNKVISWNMQGANSGTGAGANNWVTPLGWARGRYNVVSLQEAGGVPASAVATNRVMANSAVTDGPAANTYQIVEYTAGTGRTLVYIYAVQVQVTATGRTNMAIITDQPATAVRIIAPQGALTAGGGGAHNGRPSFGVQVPDATGGGTTWFWDVHAGAHPYNEAGAIVTAINNVMPAGAAWAALGDWNRDPTGPANSANNMAAALTAAGLAGTLRVVAPGAPTQQSGGEYDYMVTNDLIQGFNAVQPIGAPASDHTPVAFGYRISAMGGYQLLSPQDDNDQCMEPVGTPASGSDIDVSTCNQTAPASVNQAWYIDPSGAIRNSYLSYGYCLATAGIGALSLQSCNGSSQQLWTLTPNGTIVSQANGYCVTDSTTGVVTLTCSGNVNQNWTGYGPGPGGSGGAVGAIVSQTSVNACLFTAAGSGPIAPGANVTAQTGGGSACPLNAQGGLDSRATWTLNTNQTIENDDQMCLDETNGSAADGNPVTLAKCKATDLNQQWSISDGLIISMATGSCLTLPQGTTSGTLVTNTTTCSGAPNQLWYIPAPGNSLPVPSNGGQQFLIENVDYAGYTLCASADYGVYLKQTEDDIDPDCLWQEGIVGPYAWLYNVGKKLALTGGTGDGKAVWLSDFSGDDASQQAWNLGLNLATGGYVLRPALNTALNINGGASGSPTTSASVATTNWSASNQMTMSWVLMHLQPGTAPATSGSSTTAPPTPTTPTPPNLSGTFLLQNSANSGYGVCVNNSGTNVLAQQLYQSIDPDCLWQSSPAPNGSVYLYNPYSGMVLGTPNLNDNQTLDIQPYTPDDTYELWNFSPGQDGYGGQALRPANDTDLNLNGNAPSTQPLTITDWNVTSRQTMSWVSTPVASSYTGASQTVTLSSGRPGFRDYELCPTGNGSTVWARPASWQCTWTETTEPGGTFAFRSTSTQKLLTYTGGTTVAMAAQDNSTDQWWTFGGTEDWGAQAIRPYRNVTVNLNSGITTSGTTDPGGDIVETTDFNNASLSSWATGLFADNRDNTWSVTPVSKPARQMSVTSDATNGPVTGELTPDSTAYIQQASLTAPQIALPYTGVSQIAVASDPTNGPLVAVLVNGNVYAHQGNGGIADAGNWVQEAAGGAIGQVTQIAVASDPTNGPMIGVINANGDAYVKEGGLSTPWVDEYNGAVTSLALASDPTNGPMIGVITNGSAYVKEGGLSTPWVDEYNGAVTSLALASDPTNGPFIGIITNSTAQVKYGSLYSSWVWEYNNVSSLALATDPTNGAMIGIITNGAAQVKEGGLSNPWVDEADSGVSALAVASDPTNGPLIDAIQNGDDYVKEGNLTNGWL